MIINNIISSGRRKVSGKDLFDYIEKAWEDREMIRFYKSISRHDGKPDCPFCQGEGYLIEMPTRRRVDCTCKKLTPEEYQELLEDGL